MADSHAEIKASYKQLGGTFCGYFYIGGELAKTDRFVSKVFMPKHSFTPPFETKERNI